MDFYRLESEIALEEVGFLDLLALDAILAIEWGERFTHALPIDRLELQIDRLHSVDGKGVLVEDDKYDVKPEDTEDVHEKSPRAIRVRATGPESLQVVNAWRDALAGAGIATQEPE
jgi:hypothetical protein